MQTTRTLAKNYNQTLIYEKIIFCKALLKYFSAMGYTLQDIFGLDVTMTRLNFLRMLCKERYVNTDEYRFSLSLVEKTLRKWETKDFQMPHTKSGWHRPASMFYEFVYLYWISNSVLPVDELRDFYSRMSEGEFSNLIDDFNSSLREFKDEKQKSLPTVEEIRTVTKQRKQSHRKDKGEVQYGLYERKNITEHTFSLEEFEQYRKMFHLFPYMEKDEYEYIFKPVSACAIPLAYVKAIINQQLVDVILINKDVNYEDVEYVITYLHDTIPSVYYQQLLLKKVNEYDLDSIRRYYVNIATLFEAFDRQVREPTKYYGCRTSGHFFTLLNMALWIRTLDGVNGILIMTPETFSSFYVTKSASNCWKRITLEDALVAVKVEKGIVVYHDFKFESLASLYEKTEKKRMFYLFEQVVPEKYLTPKYKQWLIAHNIRILPWYERPKEYTEKKNVLTDGSRICLTQFEIQLVGKYLDTIKDFMNVAKTCKMYKGIFEMYKMNPIPLQGNELMLFKNIDRYSSYRGERVIYENILKNPLWDWYHEHYRGLVMKTKGDLCIEIVPKFNEEIPVMKSNRTLTSKDVMNILFDKYKEFKPDYLN